MSEEQTTDGSDPGRLAARPDLAEQVAEEYGWVVRQSVTRVIAVLRHMRDSGGEARAMRSLYAFALLRPVRELVALAHHFDGRDAIMIMATAALSRPVKEAAQLALMQHDAESDGARAPITASIVHDVACQRTALDVAVFVRVLRRRRPALAERTVAEFAGAGSGRTNLDKALLHTALLDADCPDDAGRLLELTLLAIADHAQDPLVHGRKDEEIDDLAGAFQHISPNGLVLESWVEKRLGAPDADQVDRTRHLVAKLIARPGAGHDTLAVHIGHAVHPKHVVPLCALLVKEEGEAADAKRDLVRRSAAARESLQELAELVTRWHKDPALTRTTGKLLTDIVVNPSAPDASPRPLSDLTNLSRWLSVDSGAPECVRLLHYVAAVAVEGRSGDDLVALLGRVVRHRERTRAGIEAGRRLAKSVMTHERTPAGDPWEQPLGEPTKRNDERRDWFVGCLQVLHEARQTDVVDAACRELSDPSPGSHVDASLVADVAMQLHRAKVERVGWTLLERLLENEQLVTPDDVVNVVDRAFAAPEPLPDRKLLLRATVGRWSDVSHLDKTVAALRGSPPPADPRAAGTGDADTRSAARFVTDRRTAADWIIESLR